MTVINAGHVYKICKGTGVDQRTVLEFLARLEKLRLNSSEDEDGNAPIISLQDASIEGYKMGLETGVIERLYASVMDTGFMDDLLQSQEPSVTDEPDEDPDEWPDDEEPEEDSKVEGYNYKSIAKADIARVLTNFGFKRKSARRLLRRGVPEALKFLQSKYNEQTPLIRKQWSVAIGMLSQLQEQPRESNR